MDTPQIVILTGPTAAGKTALAVDLAARYGAEIISADSRQVYRYLDIGTAKPTPEQRAAVKQKLKDMDLVAMNYGVVDIPQDETKARKVFDFAKDMGILTVAVVTKPFAFEGRRMRAAEAGIDQGALFLAVG